MARSSHPAQPGEAEPGDAGPFDSVGFDAIVLSGGTARRMGGLAKTALILDGRPVLGRVTDALCHARRVVVVGDASGASRADVSTREEPPGSGPVGALAAGLIHTAAPVVALVAGDLPLLTVDAVAALVAAVAGNDAAMVLDESGAEQYLLAAWRRAALSDRLAAVAVDAPVWRLYAGVDAVRVRLGGHPPPWWDCDTPEQFAEAQRWLQEERTP